MKIAIVGSGLIGRSFAMVFASANYHVHLYDISNNTVNEALVDIETQLNDFESRGVLRGQLSAQQQLALIRRADTLEDCLRDAIHVQECVTEDLDIKRQVFRQMDELASDSVVLCSSTSFLKPSLFTEDLKHRNQVLVGHPINPPHIIPIVEIVASKWTDKSVVDRTRSLFSSVSLKPVLTNKEVNGFAVNRIEIAVMAEAYRLIADEVISVEDMEDVFKEGFGWRWAFIGPWETVHLNRPTGMVENFEKRASSYIEVCNDFGPPPTFRDRTTEEITEAMNKLIPIEELSERRKLRDKCLTAILLLKKSMDLNE